MFLNGNGAIVAIKSIGSRKANWSAHGVDEETRTKMTAFPRTMRKYTRFVKKCLEIAIMSDAIEVAFW